jgi:hypothetical protein
MSVTSTNNGEPIDSDAMVSAPPPSQPPPLPQSASRINPVRAAADAAFADRMLERLAAADYAGTLIAAEALLVCHPLNGDVLDCAEMARSELRKIYLARLGSLDRIPHVAMGTQGLLTLSLDFRAGFLLSRVDKQTSLAEIVDRCGLAKLDALRILSELYLQRVLGFVE